MAFGLLWAIGAGGAEAARGSDGPIASSSRACPVTQVCNPPKRYHFRVSGTTDFYLGGTETYIYKGTFKRVRTTAVEAEYWQTGGTLTLTFTNLTREVPAGGVCVGHYGPNGEGTEIANAPTQTLPLRRFDEDIGFEFGPRKYEMSHEATDYPNRGAQGTVTCPDGTIFPAVFPHAGSGFITRKGKPGRVVKGSADFVDLELDHFRFSWKLTAIK